MIEKLTPEQEDLMLVYNEKWCEIMYSTEPIDCEKAADAVKQAYRAIDEKEPEIIFCDSPYEGANIVSASERLISYTKNSESTFASDFKSNCTILLGATSEKRFQRSYLSSLAAAK